MLYRGQGWIHESCALRFVLAGVGSMKMNLNCPTCGDCYGGALGIKAGQSRHDISHSMGSAPGGGRSLAFVIQA